MRVYQVVVYDVVIGVLTSLLVIHPVALVIYASDIYRSMTGGGEGLLWFLLIHPDVVLSNATTHMVIWFAVLGAVVGFVFGLMHVVLVRAQRKILALENTLAHNIPAIIAGGPRDGLTFHESATADTEPLQAMADCMNNGGGHLLLGVDSNGKITGVGNRKKFLHHMNELVEDAMGSRVCCLMHPVFQEIDGKDVCLMVVEGADAPVECKPRRKEND